MMCVALVLVLIMWLTLCMAFVTACFAPDPSSGQDSVLERVLEEVREPADTVISREIAARAVCATCSIALLISVATQYSC